MSGTPTVQIRNWERFQHYKDRSPPWIKLHRDLIEECEEWYQLSDGAARLLIELWVMASRTSDGTICRDVNGILWKLRKQGASKLIAELEELAAYDFITLGNGLASTVLASCLQVAIPEGEGEGEAEREAIAKKRKRKCTLPADWEPNSLHRERTEKEGLDLEREVEKFRAHAEANNRKVVEWNAAFTQWLIQAVEYQSKNGGKRTTPEPITLANQW